MYATVHCCLFALVVPKRLESLINLQFQSTSFLSRASAAYFSSAWVVVLCRASSPTASSPSCSYPFIIPQIMCHTVPNIMPKGPRPLASVVASRICLPIMPTAAHLVRKSACMDLVIPNSDRRVMFNRMNECVALEVKGAGKLYCGGRGVGVN